PSVLEQIESGEIHRSEDETTLRSLLSEKEFSKAWEYFKVKADTALADQTRPVAEWLKNLEQSGLITHAEQVSIVHQMNSTDGIKNAANARMMQKYLQPLMKNINALAKKHNMSVEQAKFYAEYWLSARYSIEKNNEYLANEKQKIEAALQAIEEAKNADDENAIAQATREHRRAERQYRYRKADVESQVWGRDKQGNQLYQPKVGTAGGWSIPHAQTIMRNIEAKIPAKEIEIATKPLFEAIEENLAMNLASGRITREQYHKYRQNKHYVPLTGDNEIDLEKENDYIGGAGRKAKNVSKDKAAKGRSNSEAEGAIDATWRMLDKTITNAAWQPFKNSIDELYETAKENALKAGHSEREAQKLAEEATGITKQLMKGTTRTSDDVLIRKYGDNYYEYKLPDNVMKALNSSQTVSPLGDLWGFRQIKTLTGWFARGVTQLKPMFALKNMVRDSWEKSILLTTREILGSNGKDLDQKAKNKIGRDMTKLVWGAHLGRNGIYKATGKFAKEGGTANLDDRKDAQGNYLNKEQGYLKEMIDSGALSTYSTMLARTRKDLDKEFKQYDNPTLAAKAMRLAEIWNTTFDTVSSLASYMALRENGISPAQASGLVLGLMDFRKQGSFTKHFKGFYAFLNPAIQGGKNNLMFIRTRRGQVYLASRVLMGMMVYQLLSALAGDDDEAGGKMDSKGDLSREIRIPTPLGDIRIPVGYGAPQMAWNMAVNMMRYFNGQIHLSDAVGNIVAHNAKSLMPVSPNETSVTKDPFAKIANTLTPTIFKPFVELATDRNAFGNKITPNWVNEKELHTTQSKSNTAKFWEDVAKTMYDVFGMDAHPESYQHLINAYKGFFGSAGDLATALIENPNRVAQGKPMSIPLFNDFFALKGESRVGTLYYESKAEMENLAKAYKYEQEHHPENVKTWLTPERKRLLALNEEANKAIGVVRKVKANATKGLEKKQISQAEYDKRLALYYKKVDEVQRRILFKYRTLEKLNTKKT
ncbi:LPD38 domain-containing protein, partial [Rodentibacter genomosp. 2]|uniref:LPD38 domain-containing protein n=1 Tax=Rodentibacter genomosp. 2 TaxID=1908266 RepID=UPI0015C38FA2